VTSRVLAAVATVLALGVLVAVFAITDSQGSSPALWFVVLLAAACTGLGYGAVGGPQRGAVLISASLLVLMLGVLAIFSVGLPLLVAGVLGVIGSRTALLTDGAAAP
jgi:hypothetical protein